MAWCTLVLGLLSMPFLALLPQSHPLAVSTWLLTLSGKILCYAIVAVALDLVWGYAGMLSLGHGIFFALGGYAMGMYLMRQAAGDGLPAFMSFLSWSELPWFWWGTQHFAWAMLLVVLVPGCWRWSSAGLLSALKSRGLLLDHDPGVDLRRHAALFP
jgi:urea transport system permease protein